jgi:hypothetical protein
MVSGASAVLNMERDLLANGVNGGWVVRNAARAPGSDGNSAWVGAAAAARSNPPSGLDGSAALRMNASSP